MKGIITIIIIIAIIAVGFLLLRDGTSEVAEISESSDIEDIISDVADINIELEDTPAGIDTTAEVIVVTYSNDGFAPKEIAVSVGQTVRFVNESSGNMWVASDVHPTHNILPEFDQKQSVGNGESYEFTFTKTGEWKYHNHIKPNAIGTIIVK